MANQNSLFNRYSRYTAGGTTETANGFIEWWEKTNFPADASDTLYTVEAFYTGRLDLIANTFYNEPRYWWFIAQYNNILDPISEIVTGRVLRIPTKIRMEMILGNKQGGIESTKQPVNTISPIII